MLHFVGRVDEYVIEVAHDEVVDIRPPPGGDETVEGRRCIRHSEGHNPVFEFALASSKSRHVLIAFLDVNEMVGFPEVEPGKDASSVHTTWHFRDQWKGVSILYSS